jgi:peptide deformylase
MVLPIVHYNAGVLREKGAAVTTFDASLSQLAQDMIESMHAAGGIGLAAQQIGRALHICVIDLSASHRDFTWELDGAKAPLELIMPMVLINPTFQVLPGDDTVYEEGCLSFPQIHGDVVRPDRINVSFQDLGGIRHTLICDGLMSRCIQHEVDHLNGVLFIDRMAKKIRQSIEPEVKDLAKRTREGAKTSA